MLDLASNHPLEKLSCIEQYILAATAHNFDAALPRSVSKRSQKKPKKPTLGVQGRPGLIVSDNSDDDMFEELRSSESINLLKANSKEIESLKVTVAELNKKVEAYEA